MKYDLNECVRMNNVLGLTSCLENIDIQNNNTALKTALFTNNTKITEVLVEHGLKLSHDHSKEAIHAAQAGNLALVKFFVMKKQVDMNILLKNNRTKENVKDWILLYQKR